MSPNWHKVYIIPTNLGRGQATETAHTQFQIPMVKNIFGPPVSHLNCACTKGKNVCFVTFLNIFYTPTTSTMGDLKW